jgi:hypothetical protein
MNKWIGKINIWVGHELARTETITASSKKQYWFLANKKREQLHKQGFDDVYILNPGLNKEQGKLF